MTMNSAWKYSATRTLRYLSPTTEAGASATSKSPKPPSDLWPTSIAWSCSTRVDVASVRANRRFSHAQWAADVDGLREWLEVDQFIVAGGSYGGFISLEYALAYPEHTRAVILRDTSADKSFLDRAFENARNQDRIEINWDNFNRYWQGEITDDEDLKQRWKEIIPLYDFEYNEEKSNAAVEAGLYRHEAHNWCFLYNMPNYDLRSQLPNITAPTLVTVGRTDWVTPVSSAEAIASGIPNSKLVVFEKSGHSPQKEEFDLFQSVMREFLDSLPA